MKFTLVGLLIAIILCGAYATVIKREADNPCNAEGGIEGRCFAYFPSFSYNKDTNTCYNFVYGGCGGSLNRFVTQEECESACKTN